MILIYLMFFLSGAAALIYQVVWVRSLSLVFGGTHIAVTTVLSIFMGGLAIGGFLLGRHADKLRKPLFVYGMLEIGIALFAIIFEGLMKVYPAIYGALAGGEDVSQGYLFAIRIGFSIAALIIPASFMGGTLPVLARSVTAGGDLEGRRLSLLYGFNTLGAVAGAAGAGFFLLRFYSVSAALASAVLLNLLIGTAAFILQGRAELSVHHTVPVKRGRAAGDRIAGGETTSKFSLKLAVWGIGISGFCALGYEVLWTRVLVIVVGGSVYGFTTMLIAFLTGIAAGSKSYGFFTKALKTFVKRGGRDVIGFSAVQIIIGISALFVTYHIRYLPAESLVLQASLMHIGMTLFDARLLGNFLLAFAYMAVPAFFMGLAFPLAVNIHASYGKDIGAATGEVLAFNTVGAILGAALSGFALLYLFGIERSLELLSVLNAGLGIVILAGIGGSRMLIFFAAVLPAAMLVFLSWDQTALRMWDPRYFAIFRNNQPEAFDTPEKMKEAIENTDVLLFSEGTESTISVIRTKAGNQALLVNGKVVASSTLQDRQCQLTLGHLPMLLHRNPAKKVLVIGLGTGMTLGATSVHPGVEEITLAELERGVVPAARTFGRYNHHVLDNPRLKIIFADGRNYLMTTKKKFDVITSDPIHPWTQGSGYLYTREHFKSAAEHLLPGGVMCQWLPIYELSIKDIQSVVRTFGGQFRYTMLWLTHYDAELVGSNSPIMIDEQELDRRIISVPEIADDLKKVMMGSGTDFLSYFVMGTEQLRAFGKRGVVNTDDNLYLEFSAPLSAGVNMMRANAGAIEQYRESIITYLVRPSKAGLAEEQQIRWLANGQAARLYGAAHMLFLGQRYSDPEFLRRMRELKTFYPSFAPARFLMREYRSEIGRTPVLIQKISLAFLSADGSEAVIELSAVTSRISSSMAVIDFVDNEARIIYGEIFVPESHDERTRMISARVMDEIRRTYASEAASARRKGLPFPESGAALLKIKDAITTKIGELKKDMADD